MGGKTKEEKYKSQFYVKSYEKERRNNGDVQQRLSGPLMPEYVQTTGRKTVQKISKKRKGEVKIRVH